MWASDFGLIFSQFVFSCSRAQRDWFWITDKTHAGVYVWLFYSFIYLFKIIQPSEEHRHVSHNLGRGCRCSRADRGIQGGDRAFNNEAQGIYCPAHPGQKNGHFDSQRGSSVHWRTMSQEEPRSELSTECFIYCHPHERPGLRLVWGWGWGFQNNADNSERTKDLRAQRRRIAALSLTLSSRPTHCLPLIWLSLRSASNLSSLDDCALRQKRVWTSFFRSSLQPISIVLCQKPGCSESQTNLKLIQQCQWN